MSATTKSQSAKAAKVATNNNAAVVAAKETENVSLHKLAIEASKALKAESKNLSKAVETLLTSETAEAKAWLQNFDRETIFRLIKTQPAREKWSPYFVMITVNKAFRLENKAQKAQKSDRERYFVI